MCDEPSFRERVCEALTSLWVALSVFWRKQLRPGTSLAGGVLLIYGVGTYLRDQEIPDAATWARGTTASIAWTTAGILAAVTSFLVLMGYRRLLRIKKEEETLYSACQSALRVVHTATEIPYTQLGAHVWTITGFPFGRHLVRRATYLPDSRPQSNVRWVKGRGAIGKCWQSGEEAVEDLEVFDGLSEQEFCDLPRATRLGLSWTDFKKSDHYRAIWVTPIYKGPDRSRKLGGCMSVEVVRQNGAAQKLLMATDNNVEIGRVLAVCDGVL
jgi:hypothetical protein